MNLYSDFEALDSSIKLLGIESSRKRATSDIKLHVEAAARELSLERFSNFENELYGKIFSLLYGPVLEEKIGGVVAIKELIECTSAAAETKVIKFSNTLANVLKVNTDFNLIELVAYAFGHMARNSPISQVDFVECEFNRALEWLKYEQPHRKFAACSVLQQLAENAPTVFFTKIRDFFGLIWGSLWDPKDRIRFSAAKALSACLSVLRQRTYHLEWYCNIYSNIQEGLRKGTAESIHGSLLVVMEMLIYTGNFMIPRFKETSNAIMQFRDHKSIVVKAAIAQLLPALAQFCPDAFSGSKHLNEAVEFLLKCAKLPELRTQALVSTGQLCLAVGENLDDKVEDLLQIVEISLQSPSASSSSSSGHPSSHSRRQYAIGAESDVVDEALKCIASLVQGLGAVINDKIMLLLDLMFQLGITPNLIDTLSVVVKYVPSQLDVIQEKLLLETTKVLGGESKLVVAKPEHLYSWSRQGVRSYNHSKHPLLRKTHFLTTQGTYVPIPTSSHTATPRLPHDRAGQVTGGYTAAAGGREPGSGHYLTVDDILHTQSQSNINFHLQSQFQRKLNTGQSYAANTDDSSIPAAGGGGGGLSELLSNSLSCFGLSCASTDDSADAQRSGRSRRPSRLIVLALKTLGSLTLSSSDIIPLLNHSVLPYFESTDYTVRREAAITCCHMLSLCMMKTSLVKESGDSSSSSDHGVPQQQSHHPSLSLNTSFPCSPMDERPMRRNSSSGSIGGFGSSPYHSSAAGAGTGPSLLSPGAAGPPPPYSARTRKGSDLSLSSPFVSTPPKSGRKTSFDNENSMFLVPKPLRSSRESTTSDIYSFVMAERSEQWLQGAGAAGGSTMTHDSEGGTVFRRAGYSRNPLSRLNTPVPPTSSDYTNLHTNFGQRSTSLGSVDRLGGVTPALQFSSQRYINHKPAIYTRGPTSMAIDFILVKLLQLVVSDPSHEVRSANLRCILETQIFDYYLSRKHHLDTMLFLLADEFFDIKIDALTILGRLAFINPGLVLPPLRVLLLRLISEMSNAAENRLKEEAILMVCRFLNSPSLHVTIRAYIGTLIKVLPLDQDIRLTTASLECIGEICKVMRQDMNVYFDQLLPIIVRNFHDQSSRKKQEVAITTLGLLVGATGKAVIPYMKYPQILPKALDLLFKSSVNTPWSLRMQTLRAIGLLGALEPRKYALIASHLVQLASTVDSTSTALSGTMNRNASRNKKGVNGAKLNSEPAFDMIRPKQNAIHHMTDMNVLRLRSGTDNSADPVNKYQFQVSYSQELSSSSSTVAAGDRIRAGSSLGHAVSSAAEDSLVRVEVLLEEDNADLPVHLFMYHQCVMKSVPAPLMEEAKRKTPHNEDYYPRMAVSALMKVLYEKSLAIHHSSVAQAIMIIFKSLGMKSIPFLDETVPFLLHLLRTCGPGLRESLLQELSTLVSIVQYHITPYLPAIFEIIRDFWFGHLEQILYLVEEIAITASNQFGSYFTVVLPLLLSSITVPKNITATSFKKLLLTSPAAAVYMFKPLEQTLSCCHALRTILLPHLHLIVPTLCKLIYSLQEVGTDTIHWQVLTIRTIRRVCTVPTGYSSITDQSDVVISRLVHCLSKTIELTNSLSPSAGVVINSYGQPVSQAITSSLINARSHTYNNNITALLAESIHTLCCIGFQIGPRFLTFDSLILRTVNSCNNDMKIFTEYVEFSRLLNTGKLKEYDYGDREIHSSSVEEDYYFDPHKQHLRSSNLGVGSMHNNGFNHSGYETDMVGIGSYYVSGGVRHGHGNHGVGGMIRQQQQTADVSAGAGSVGAKLSFNQQQLSRAWDVSQRSTANDWAEWFRRLKVELIRESPNAALRACSSLCQAYAPLANELFHAAFVSCWYELNEQYQDSLVKALQVAFRSVTIPPDCLQTLLNLAEFMEHDVEALPISLTILAELAQKSHAYAKALHYRELEFALHYKGFVQRSGYDAPSTYTLKTSGSVHSLHPSHIGSGSSNGGNASSPAAVNPASCFESLITINKKLDQYDAAVGILTIAEKMKKENPSMSQEYTVHESWLAKLGHWSEAILKYEQRLSVHRHDGEAIAGKLKCLDALGRWEEAIALCNETLDYLHSDDNQLDLSLLILGGSGALPSPAATAGTDEASKGWTAGGVSLSRKSTVDGAVLDSISTRVPTRLYKSHSIDSIGHGLSAAGGMLGDDDDEPAHSVGSSSHGQDLPLSYTLPSETKRTSRPGYMSAASKHVSTQQKRLYSKIVVIGARSAWSLNEWNLMNSFVQELPNDNIDACFMRAVLAIHNENYSKSAQLIEQTRKYLDSTITALLAESYGRAYVPLIMVQQCSELEEIAEFKLLLREAGMDDSISGGVGITNQGSSSSSSSSIANTTHDQHGFVTSDFPSSSFKAAPPVFSRSSSHQLSDAANYSMSPLRALNSSFHGSVPPMSPRTRSTLKLSDFNSEDNTSTISNEQSQQFVLQLEARRRKILLVEKWRRRLKGCCSSGRAAIPVWKYLLNGRRMILSEREDLDTWLDFATLCRNGGNTALAERVLSMAQRLSSSSGIGALSGAHSVMDDKSVSQDRRIQLAILKQQWVVSDRRSALLGLEQLIQSIGYSNTGGYGSSINNNPPSSSIWNSGSSPVSLNLPEHGSGAGESHSMLPLPILMRSLTQMSSMDSSVYLDCMLTLGEWKVSILGPDETIDPVTRRQVLALYGTATSIDPSCYQAWHCWGLANVRAIEEAKLAILNSKNSISSSILSSLDSARDSSGDRRRLSVSPHTVPLARSVSTGGGSSPKKRSRSATQVNHSTEIVMPLAVNAIHGLMRALTLGTKRWSSTVTEDMLCIMQLWFRYAHLPEVSDAIEQRLSQVHCDVWLGILPQLIARIDTPGENARNLLHQLLIRLGEKHAQALVYPLSVALKSPREERKRAAEKLMNSLKLHSKVLIEQALLVSQELIRVAILWQEVWHESFEEASRQYFGMGDIQGMLDTLLPLHHLLQQGAMTHRETSFINAYGADLNEAYNCIMEYIAIMRSKNLPLPTHSVPNRQSSLLPEDSLLHQAWDIYYSVFKRINVELASITSLELQFCSPSLLSSRDLDLGVPGTYSTSGDAVRIAHFGPTIAIIRSKQRPRKIRIYGHNGEEFVFLLKGHEDLRQDERAMQLFGLVNALLQHDSRIGGESHDLSIQRYAVVPLSPTAGLISWVPNSDTLHDLIRDFRDARKIMLNLEHKIMMQLAPNDTYDKLTHPQKLEVFLHALAMTDGDDLAKILWLKSETSEIWLNRRTNYTRSLAVMSMVGYVLGLGDRHPSNLMLDRKSGKVLHIDFGDCFEVAQQREKFPEKVPFRLTRMLVKAMEVSGIEGSYRLTCEKVMTVLRENRDSLIAVLEAFVHDPLLSWRLLNTVDRNSSSRDNSKKPPSTKAEDVKAQGQCTPEIKMVIVGAVIDDGPYTDLSAAATPAPPAETATNVSSEESTVAAAKQSDPLYRSRVISALQADEVNSQPASVAATTAITTTTPSVSYNQTTAIEYRGNSNHDVLVPIVGGFSHQRHRYWTGGESSAQTPDASSGTAVGVAILLQKHSNALTGLPSAVTSAVPLIDSARVIHTPDIEQLESRDNFDEIPRFEEITSSIRQSHNRRATALAVNMNRIAMPTATTVNGTAAAASSGVTQSVTIIPLSLTASTTSSAVPVANTAHTTAAPVHSANAAVDAQSPRLVSPRTLRGSVGSSYKPNLHLEIASLANGHNSGFSLRQRQSIRSLSMAEQRGVMDGSSSSSVRRNTTSQPAAAAGDGEALRHTSSDESEANLSDSSELNLSGVDGVEDGLQEELKEKAVVVIRRVKDKLTGLDFYGTNAHPIAAGQQQGQQQGAKIIAPLDVHEQVDKLILQATSNELLCQGFFGWCPFW